MAGCYFQVAPSSSRGSNQIGQRFEVRISGIHNSPGSARQHQGDPDGSCTPAIKARCIDTSPQCQRHASHDSGQSRLDISKTRPVFVLDGVVCGPVRIAIHKQSCVGMSTGAVSTGKGQAHCPRSAWMLGLRSKSSALSGCCSRWVGL